MVDIAPEVPKPRLRCRSLGPDGQRCVRRRAHPRLKHGTAHGHRDPQLNIEWEGGIHTPAKYDQVDDGYRTDGDYASWMNLR